MPFQPHGRKIILLPLFQFVNWVKVYEYKPGQGDNGTDFKLLWTDNFDTFDSNRWDTGDWTSDGNRVDFTPNSVYCQEGMLILALTRKGQESFSGQVPIDVVAHPVTTVAGTDYWTTFYNNSYHFKADDNTTVYKATLNGSSLKLTEVADRIVTKGNAVILKSTGNPTMTVSSTASTDGYANGTNDLKGGSLSDPTNYDAYTLSRGSTGTGTLGFYKFNGSSLDGNKAHLEIAKSNPGSPAREFIGFGDDETTSLTPNGPTPNPIPEQSSPTRSLSLYGGEWYDLQGQKLSGKPTKKGVYVRNGQKVVIK